MAIAYSIQFNNESVRLKIHTYTHADKRKRKEKTIHILT